VISPEVWKRGARAFSHRGLKVAYWTSAEEDTETEKPALLLIHGFPTSSWDWSWMWDDLATRFRLYACDMIGFGLTDKPRGREILLMEQADLQEALLAELGVGEAHVLAHDYGVSVAQELIARANENALSFGLKSVCFLNGGLFPAHHRALFIQKVAAGPFGFLVSAAMGRAQLEKSFDRVFGPETKPSQAELDGHWQFIREQNGHRLTHRLMRYIPQRREHAARWAGALDEARAPLAMVNGGADPISGRHLYTAFTERLPKAYGVLLDDIGHYPQTEAAPRVRDAFIAFHETIKTFEGEAA